MLGEAGAKAEAEAENYRAQQEAAANKMLLTKEKLQLEAVRAIEEEYVRWLRACKLLQHGVGHRGFERSRHARAGRELSAVAARAGQR